MNQSRSSQIYGALAAFTVLAVAFAHFLPLVDEIRTWRIFAATYSVPHFGFEMFGMAGSVALLLAAAWFYQWLVRQENTSRAGLIAAGAFLAVGFTWLNLLVDFNTGASRDYRVYEKAAFTLMEGKNPWPGMGYLYPPLLAQVLRLVYESLEAITPNYPSWFHSGTTNQTRLYLMHQSSIFTAGMLCFVMAYEWARRCGLKASEAAILLAVVFIVSSPVIRTFRHNQVNIHVLACFLAALLFSQSRPWLAGAALALGVHLKVFPLILLGPWLFTGRWKAALWAAGWFVGIVFVQTGFFRDWTLWRQYIAFFPRVGGTSAFDQFPYFRSVSVGVFVSQTFRLLLGDEVKNPEPWRQLVSGLIRLLQLALAAYFAWRFFWRQRLARGGNVPALRDRFHDVDAVIFSLLVSFLSWTHHFVLAIPAVILAWGTAGQRFPAGMAVITASLFLIPTFDLYPLSFHRLFSLFALIGLLHLAARDTLPQAKQKAPDQASTADGDVPVAR